MPETKYECGKCHQMFTFTCSVWNEMSVLRWAVIPQRVVIMPQPLRWLGRSFLYVEIY